MAVPLYLSLKIVLFGGLVVLWGRLLQVRNSALLTVFVLFAYAGAAYVDLIVGNVTVFEQCLLWAGFAFLLKEKYAGFCLLLIAASLFKLVPISLAVILFWVPHPHRYRYFAATIFGFVAILAVTYLVSPQLMTEFVGDVAVFDERGRTNPAALPLIRDAAVLFSREYAFRLLPFTPTVAYLLLIALIAIPTWVTVQRIAGSEAPDRLRVLFYFLIMAYAVVLPRFKIYSYMLLIVPTYYIITNARRTRSAIPLTLLVGLPIQTLMFTAENQALIWEYLPWFTALGVWVLYVYEIHGGLLRHRPQSL